MLFYNPDLYFITGNQFISACIKGSLGVSDSQKLPRDFQKSMSGSLGLPTFKDILSFITKI